MNDSPELKKHVHVIHSYNQFTLVQRKLVNALLYNAYYELPRKSTFEIKTRELCDLIGFNSRDIASLKRSLKGVLSTIIEWNIIDGNSKDQDKWSATTMLSSAEIYKGVCTYSYNDLLKTLLYKPEMYGNIDMQLMKKFKSNYSLALYENCIRYKKIKQTSWLTFQAFRKLMGVNDSKYKNFKDFKKRVINVAVNEVNDISPIKVCAEINKKDQEIRFIISKTKITESIPTNIDDDNEIMFVLTETFGVANQVAKKLINEYEEKYIKEKIEIISNSSSFKSGAIKHLAGYLVEALSKDYQGPVSSKVAVRKIERDKDIAKKKATKKQMLFDERYEKYINDTYSKVEKALGMDKYEDLKRLYIQRVSLNNITGKYYKEQGFNHPMIRGGFKNFLKESQPEKFEHVLSEREFKDMIE